VTAVLRSAAPACAQGAELTGPAAAASQPFERRAACVLGLPFDLIDMDGAVARVREAVRTRRQCVIATPNLNFVVQARRDPAFRDSVLNADLSLADGMPILWAARLCGIPLPERVTGSGLLERLQQDTSGPKVRVYLFGGPDGAGEAAAERINAAGGGLHCVGYECPGFGSAEALSRPESIARINASGADFLVVALGAAKGKAWIERNRAALTVPVVSHLGAAINFAAGTVRRAPGWMQRAGLEWLWRVKEEPVLWRRYFSDGLALIGALAREVIPLAWSLRSSAGHDAVAPARATVEDGNAVLTVRLEGGCVAPHLASVRKAFTTAAGGARDTRIDLARAEGIDAEFLALAVLLQARLRKRGAALELANLPIPLRRLAQRAGCGYLLERCA
jgi:N-acetylglucosaminyldiphosphoundecaprenol N-acetyl-beta-D-mannosaminyltransferase